MPPVAAGTSGTIVISGTIPLVSYNVTATDIGADKATITWKTNGAANSAVEYGLTTGYGSTSTDDVMNTSHTIQLIGLSVPKEYHYRVISKMIDGRSYTSPDATFKTVYPAGTTIATKTAGTTVTGVTTTTVDGAQQVNITSSTVQGTTQVSGNTVTVTNPGNGWSSLQYTGTKVTNDGNDITIDGIQGVVMKSEPVSADLGGDIGTVSTQVNIPLTELVSDVSIQQNVIMGASSSAANAFQLAATSSSLDVKSVAYTVEFQNTGALNAKLGSAGVTLELGIDHGWVVANAPNGDRNNIRIIRSGEDGIKEVLNTQYIGSEGTTDKFRAESKRGLSIFGMVAVSSTSGGGGGGSGGGSSGDSGSDSSGGGSSSDSSGGLLGLITGQKSDQKPSAPVEPQVIPQPAPRDENAPTTTRSLAIAGITVTTGSAGKQILSFDTARAEQSGTTVSVSGNVITISQPGFTITVITRDTPIKENGVISGAVQSVRLHTAPAHADTSTGTVSISVDTALAAIPENAAITTTISETVNQDIQDAFRSAARSHNQQVKGI
ncbi:MAG: fibronectin type III domain-containing protein, partial [Methanoregula sp.]